METFLATLIMGLFISALGIINMTGNISTIHRYHRHRVSEENIKPFGRLVGIGTLVVGISLIIFGALSLVYDKTQSETANIIGTVILIVGIVVGLFITFYAMIKYNKGIF